MRRTLTTLVVYGGMVIALCVAGWIMVRAGWTKWKEWVDGSEEGDDD